MLNVTKKKHDNTNYSFTFLCLEALVSAAIVTAGLLAGAAEYRTAIEATASTTKALTTSAIVTSSVLPIVLPVVGILLLIGGICLLPYLFSENTRSTTYVNLSSRPYSNWNSGPSWWSPSYGGGNAGNQHSHPPAYTGSHTNHQHDHTPTHTGGYDSHQHGHH